MSQLLTLKSSKDAKFGTKEENSNVLTAFNSSFIQVGDQLVFGQALVIILSQSLLL